MEGGSLALYAAHGLNIHKVNSNSIFCYNKKNKFLKKVLCTLVTNQKYLKNIEYIVNLRQSYIVLKKKQSLSQTPGP